CLSRKHSIGLAEAERDDCGNTTRRSRLRDGGHAAREEDPGRLVASRLPHIPLPRSRLVRALFLNLGRGYESPMPVNWREISGWEASRLNWRARAEGQFEIPHARPKDGKRPKTVGFGKRGTIPRTLDHRSSSPLALTPISSCERYAMTTALLTVAVILALSGTVSLIVGQYFRLGWFGGLPLRKLPIYFR